LRLHTMKISVMLHNLKMEPYEGLKKIVEMGVQGVHLSIGRGVFAPENLDAQQRKDLREHIASLGLELSATSAGGVDLANPEDMENKIAWMKGIMDLTRDLGTDICQSHAGIVPADEDEPNWRSMVEGCKVLAEYGEETGVVLALETGPEPPEIMARLIEAVNSPALRINYDPANFVIWPALLSERNNVPYDKEKALAEFKPVEGVKILGPYIVHTHAKDALVHENGKRQEVPLGEGWIDWPRYIELLKEVGYDGYFAIERETGADPVGDVQRAVDFLKSLNW
jgi:L-ribulose-5-phosphate 3-epimerase